MDIFHTSKSKDSKDFRLF